MTIDMHSHWFPAKLADAFRQRKTKPMIHTKEDGIEYMKSMFSAPLRTEQLDTRLEEMDRTGVERGVISLTTVFGVEGCPRTRRSRCAGSTTMGLRNSARNILRGSRSSRPCRSATSTLPIAEFERAMKLPGAVGCLLPGDGFLSLKRAERFRPLLEVVDRYSAMALVHYGKTANDAEPIKVDASETATAGSAQRLECRHGCRRT